MQTTITVHSLIDDTPRGQHAGAREPYRSFAHAIMEATAQARVAAEIALYGKPLEEPNLKALQTWLTRGPGRERADEQGWTVASDRRRRPRLKSCGSFWRATTPNSMPSSSRACTPRLPPPPLRRRFLPRTLLPLQLRRQLLQVETQHPAQTQQRRQFRVRHRPVLHLPQRRDRDTGSVGHLLLGQPGRLPCPPQSFLETHLALQRQRQRHGPNPPAVYQEYPSSATTCQDSTPPLFFQDWACIATPKLIPL